MTDPKAQYHTVLPEKISRRKAVKSKQSRCRKRKQQDRKIKEQFLHGLEKILERSIEIYKSADDHQYEIHYDGIVIIIQIDIFDISEYGKHVDHGRDPERAL